MREYRFRLPIRWMDMDAYGHVNNASYFDYMVETRFHFFNQSDLLKEWMEKEQVQFVMVKQTIEYLKPLTFPGEVEIIQVLKSVGNTSVEFDYELNLISDYVTHYAKSSAKLVAYSLKTKHSISFPEKLKQKIF